MLVIIGSILKYIIVIGIHKILRRLLFEKTPYPWDIITIQYLISIAGIYIYYQVYVMPSIIPLVVVYCLINAFAVLCCYVYLLINKKVFLLKDLLLFGVIHVCFSIGSLYVLGLILIELAGYF